MIQDILIINSYAGSLTLAATQAGLRIRGSYEDAGYGLKTQRLNFPDLRYVEKLPWPVDDLRSTVVIAHPPCAAFSMNNVSNYKIHGKREYLGTSTDAFRCHERVMDYALGLGCAALLIESVPRMLEGARSVHDAYAMRYRYKLYRVLQNAVTFGVPQWRERCWVIFARDLDTLTLFHRQRVRCLGEVVGEEPTGKVNHYVVRGIKRQLDKLKASGGLTKMQVDELMTGETYGHLGQAISHYLSESYDYAEYTRRFNLLPFDNQRFWFLDPAGFAPVLVQNSYWTMGGRPLTKTQYNLVMGFPPDYKFESDSRQTVLLSKGVCPPVANWLLIEMLGMLRGGNLRFPLRRPGDRTFILKPGELADFRVTRRRVKNGTLEWKEMST